MVDLDFNHEAEKGEYKEVAVCADDIFAEKQNEIYSNEECKYPFGLMSVQLDKQFYEPGDTLIGMIYLKVDEAFKCEKVLLDVESEEKAAFTRFWFRYEHETDDDGHTHTHSIEEHERHKESHEGFEFKSKLLDLDVYGDQFQPGNYAIQF